MIVFSSDETVSSVKRMWKTCFGDSDLYIDLRFKEKYKDENTLIYIHEGSIVSSLHMTPYTMTFYGEEISIYYIEGLSTLPEYRGRGYMGKLIGKAHEIASERQIPLTVLVPAEDSLFGYYGKYGYGQIADKGSEDIGLKNILNNTANIEQAYRFFNDKCRTEDFCIQKSWEDFHTIVSDYEADGRPEKFNLAAMGRIINVSPLLNLFAHKNPDTSITLVIDDPDIAANTGAYEIRNGKCLKIDTINFKPDFVLDTALLCGLLFGYKINEMGLEYRNIFQTHHPIINLMLE